MHADVNVDAVLANLINKGDPMKRVILAVLVAMVVMVVPMHVNAGDGPIAAGVKAWSFTDDGLTGFAAGPTLSWDMGANAWGSAMILVGTVEADDFDFSWTQVDAEVLVGTSASAFDFGVGLRYTTLGSEVLDDSLGTLSLMLYGAAAAPFGDTGLGAYVGSSLVPFDVWTSEDSIESEMYLNAEAGLYYGGALTATVGFRTKIYFGDADLTFSGPAVSAGYRF